MISKPDLLSQEEGNIFYLTWIETTLPSDIIMKMGDNFGFENSAQETRMSLG